MPGINFRHSSDDTPPSVMGISTDSPVRLSVIVTVSATASPYLGCIGNARDSYPLGRSGAAGERAIATDARATRQEVRFCHVVAVIWGEMSEFHSHNVEKREPTSPGTPLRAAFAFGP